MEDIVIVAAARTAVGKFGGTLAATPATELGAIVVKGLLERSGVDPQARRRGHPRPGARRRLPARTRRASRCSRPACRRRRRR